MTEFHAVQWWLQLHDEVNALRYLQSLAEDWKTLEYHVDGMVDPLSGSPLQFTEEESEALIDFESRSISAENVVAQALSEGTDFHRNLATKMVQRGHVTGSVLRAFATYRRQAVVLAVTYEEIVVEDFLLALFTAKPKAMYEYVNPVPQQKGKVDLKDVLEVDSREALLNNLALRSAKHLGQFKLNTIAKTIQKVTGHALDQELIEQLERLVARRNKLVHEPDDSAVDQEEAKNALIAVARLVEQLDRIAGAFGIPTTILDLKREFEMFWSLPD